MRIFRESLSLTAGVAAFGMGVGLASGQSFLPQASLDQTPQFALYASLDGASPEHVGATREVIQRLAEQAGQADELEQMDELDQDEYAEQWQALQQTGLRGVAMVGGMGNDDGAAYLFLEREEGTDLDQMRDSLAGLRELMLAQAEQHEDELPTDDLEELEDLDIHELDARWAYVSGAQFQTPGDGAATDVSELEAALGEAGDEAFLRMAFVMSDEMRQAIAQPQGQPGSPNQAMAMGMAQQMQGLERGVMSVQLGETPHAELLLDFEDDNAASGVRQGVQEFTQMIGQMAAMGAMQDPEGPDINPQQISQALGQLVPEQDGSRLHKRFDEGLVQGLIDSGIFELGNQMR